MASARGRPRGFDRDEALERLMQVFWAKGYEGAQLNDLTAAVGVKPPSFYAAFGSKEAAFHEAVDLYIATIGGTQMRALDEGATVRDGLLAMLEGSVAVALSTKPGGCLLILGAVNGQPANAAVRAHLLQARRKTVALITARLRRGVADGDLPASTDIDRLAAFYHGILQAISFQARDGATREDLRGLIAPSLRALDPG